MKNFIIILLATLLSSFAFKDLMPGGHKLTMQEAEKILGEPCQLKEDGSTAIGDGHQYKSTYLANSSNEKITIALYFNFESYKDEALAKTKFKTFKTSNQEFRGFEALSDLGDEAFFHSDSENFCLIVVRKENEMLLLKVNKITSKTSIQQLKRIAADLIGRI